MIIITLNKLTLNLILSFIMKQTNRMYHLDTYYPTLVHDDYIIDPSIMKHLIQDTTKKRTVVYYNRDNKFNPYNKYFYSSD